MITKRNVYLKMKPLEEARQILFDHFSGTGTTAAETVSPPDAVGRVLAEPLTAAVSSPNFHAAAMDGVAVKAQETFGASETRPKELTVGTQALFLNTGHVMPEGTDAVIMIENIQTVGDDRIRSGCGAYVLQGLSLRFYFGIGFDLSRIWSLGLGWWLDAEHGCRRLGWRHRGACYCWHIGTDSG